jgi:hypothetical protein
MVTRIRRGTGQPLANFGATGHRRRRIGHRPRWRRHNRRMSRSEQGQPGEIRFTATGDVEIFDGRRWLPVRSILTDPALGNRSGAEDDAASGTRQEAAPER